MPPNYNADHREIGPPPPPPIEFRADQPFFIVLRHKRTGVKLFMGRVAEV